MAQLIRDSGGESASLEIIDEDSLWTDIGGNCDEGLALGLVESPCPEIMYNAL